MIKRILSVIITGVIVGTIVSLLVQFFLQSIDFLSNLLRRDSKLISISDDYYLLKILLFFFLIPFVVGLVVGVISESK